MAERAFAAGMDPVTQGALGAVVAIAFAPPERTRAAAVLGALGGMAADLDIFIRSGSDPLLNIEYHRHFTHALAFVPVGGLICAGVLAWLFRRRLRFAAVYGYATAGYATAGLLDACTSYGTQLLWPFSDLRVAWNLVSAVDPLYTVPLLALLLVAVVRCRPAWARAGVVFGLAYLALGFVQRERAAAGLEALAADRGHDGFTRATVKPSLGNLVLWRGIYEHDGRYYIDAVRVGFGGEPRIYPGESVAVFDVAAAAEALPADSVLADDLRRFAHFSDGYVAALPDQPGFLTDVRYSPVPHALEPLWGIDLAGRGPEDHVDWVQRRGVDAEQRDAFLRMLRGKPVEPSAGAESDAR